MDKLIDLLKKEEDIELKVFKDEEVDGRLLNEIDIDITISNCTFINCTFVNILKNNTLIFYNSTFINCKFKNVSIWAKECNFVGCDFKEIEKGTFKLCCIRQTEFKNTKLYMYLLGCDIQKSTFYKCKMNLYISQSEENGFNSQCDNIKITECDITNLEIICASCRNLILKDNKIYENFKVTYSNLYGAEIENNKLNHITIFHSNLSLATIKHTAFKVDSKKHLQYNSLYETKIINTNLSDALIDEEDFYYTQVFNCGITTPINLKYYYTLEEIEKNFGIKPATIRSYISREQIIPKDKYIKYNDKIYILKSFADEMWNNEF